MSETETEKEFNYIPESVQLFRWNHVPSAQDLEKEENSPTILEIKDDSLDDIIPFKDEKEIELVT